MWKQLVEQLFNGVLTGSAYALLALGLALVYGVLGIINFAHGELYMLGAYLMFLLVALWEIPYVPALIIVLFVGFGFGLAMNEMAFEPLRDRPKVHTLISSIGVSVFLSNAALVWFGASPRFLNLSFGEQTIRLGEDTVSVYRLWVLLLAVMLILGTWILLQKTHFGRAIRAVAEDSDAAALMGVAPRFVRAGCVAMSAALAGFAGALFAPLFVINPFIGTLAGLKAFAVVIVGGFGNLRGVLLASLLLGVAESLATGFVSSTYRDALSFSILLVALVVRPRGIVRELGEESV